MYNNCKVRCFDGGVTYTLVERQGYPKEYKVTWKDAFGVFKESDYTYDDTWITETLEKGIWFLVGVTMNQFDSSLESRKNDKNQMELVDTGFPNALTVLGEVMTWAAKNKGYLPNDWKDIPNPSMSLLGAASRHRNKRLKGEEFDDESGLPHLAHEAFNVLAQLELLMTGKLK